MPRYIDAEPLKKQIADFKKTVNSPNSDYMTGYVSALSATEGIIAALPAADVVEVVRCKDCVSCNVIYPAKPIGEEALEGWYCTKFRQYRNADSFCSYGERKEE